MVSKRKVLKYQGTVIQDGGFFFLNPFEVTNFDSRPAPEGEVYLSVRFHKKRKLIRGSIEARYDFIVDEHGDGEFKATEYLFFPHNSHQREKLARMSREGAQGTSSFSENGETVYILNLKS